MSTPRRDLADTEPRASSSLSLRRASRVPRRRKPIAHPRGTYFGWLGRRKAETADGFETTPALLPADVLRCPDARPPRASNGLACGVARPIPLVARPWGFVRFDVRMAPISARAWTAVISAMRPSNGGLSERLRSATNDNTPMIPITATQPMISLAVTRPTNFNGLSLCPKTIVRRGPRDARCE
jgi:hypothetical protein